MVAAGVGRGGDEQAALKRVAGEAIAKDEIAGGRRSIGGIKRDQGLGGRAVADRDGVSVAGGLADGDAGGEAEREGEGGGIGLAGREVGIGDPLRGGRRRGGGGRGAVGVARADGAGVGELVDSVGGRKEFSVAQLDLDGVAREDVGHGHGEDVGAMLFEEGGGVSGGFGGLVGGAGFFLFLDPGADAAIAHGHGEAMHGGAGGAGENVERFERGGAGVGVGLGDGDVGDDSRDDGVDAGGFEREGVAGGVEGSDVEVGRERAVGVGGRALGSEARGEGGAGEERRRSREKHAAGGEGKG